MKCCNIILLLLFINIPSLSFADTQKVLFVTEDLPPLQIEQATKPPKGALIELVNLIITEANIDATIEIFPWARSYELALNQPNTFIFSMLRSEEREKKFHWVGKLFTIKSYLAKLSSRTDIEINTINDAKKYAVGSIRHDLAETYLLKKGFKPNKNLYVSSKYPILWNMLYSGRTDVAFTNSIIWQHEITKAGLDPGKLSLTYEIPDFASDLYLAASLGTDKAVLQKIKNSLTAIKTDGRYNKIMTKWKLFSP